MHIEFLVCLSRRIFSVKALHAESSQETLSSSSSLGSFNHCSFLFIIMCQTAFFDKLHQRHQYQYDHHPDITQAWKYQYTEIIPISIWPPSRYCTGLKISILKYSQYQYDHHPFIFNWHRPNISCLSIPKLIVEEDRGHACNCVGSFLPACIGYRWALKACQEGGWPNWTIHTLYHPVYEEKHLPLLQ